MRGDRIAPHMKAKHTADIGKMLVAGYTSGDNDTLYHIIKGKYDSPITVPSDEDAFYYFGVHPKRCCDKTPNEEVRQYRAVPENMKQYELFLREAMDTLSFFDDIVPIIDRMAEDSNVVKEAKRSAAKAEALVALRDETIESLVKQMVEVKKQNDAMEDALGMQEGGWTELQRLKERNASIERLYNDAKEEVNYLKRYMDEMREKEEKKHIQLRQMNAERSIEQDEMLIQVQRDYAKLKASVDEKIAKGVQKALDAKKKKKKAAAKKIKMAMAAASSDSDSDSDSD